MIFFMINIKKVSQKDLVRADEISTARAICNLYSCYKKKHLFSTNQKCVIFHVHYCFKNLPLQHEMNCMAGSKEIYL